MGWFRRLTSGRAYQSDETVVTFTGGMGAQIISAAIYFQMKQAGQMVYADLSYFNQPEKVAEVGSKGECSHWSWQLGPFGFNLSDFDVCPTQLRKTEVDRIEDGARKLELGLRALSMPDVQKRFQIPAGICDVLSDFNGAAYLCIHIRRGDYVNVASHLVADEEFVSLAQKLTGLLNHAVVVSDSKIPETLKDQMDALFKSTAYCDNVDAFTTHRIMRNAKALVCSNSQFSLIAAMLNNSALTFLPKKWFGDDHRAIEAPLRVMSSFEVLEVRS